MIEVSLRTKRMASLWAVNFAKILAALVASVTIGGSIGYLIVVAANAYGTTVVLFSIAGIWLLALAAAIAGSISESQLSKMEMQEEDMMRRLRNIK